MSFHRLDNFWRILGSHDTYGKGLDPFQKRTNLLVDFTDSTPFDAGAEDSMLAVRGFQMIPMGASVQQVKQGFFPPTADEYMSSFPVTFALNHDMMQSFSQGKVMIWNIKDSFPDTNSEWEIDSFSKIFPLNQDKPGPLRVVEMFSGAMGGWSFASKLIQKSTGLPIQMVGIERDAQAAAIYAATHQAQMIHGKAKVARDFLASGQDTVICTDITDPEWIAPVSFWRPDVVVMSPPCPPWSKAGAEQGLGDERGLAFAEAIGITKLLRPKVLIIEQVAGFPIHGDAKHIMQQIQAAGYRLHWSRIVDASEQCAATRFRWLCIALLMHDKHVRPVTFQTWQKRTCVTPHTVGSIITWTQHLLDELQVTGEALKIAKNPSMLPFSMKNMSHAVNTDTLSMRCHHGDAKLPTFMAQYGKQHHLPTHSLESKGYMGHFHRPANMPPRYWHPIEVGLHHVIPEGFVLPKNHEQGWLFTGNMITPAHAMLALANGINCIAQRYTALDVPTLIDAIWEQRLTASNSIIQFWGNTISIAKTDDCTFQYEYMQRCADLVKKVEQFQFPEDLSWSPKWGFTTIQKDEEVSQLTHIDAESSEEAMQNFHPVQSACLDTQDARQTFCVAAHFPTSDVAAVWGETFEASNLEQSETDRTGHAIRVAYSPNTHVVHDSSSVAVAFVDQGILTVYKAEPAQDLHMQAKQWFLPASAHDQFGPILPGQHVHPDILLFPHALDTSRITQPVTFSLAALKALSHSNCYWDPTDCIFHMTGEGERIHAQTAMEFWTSLLSSQELMMMGLMVSGEFTSKGFHCQFTPSATTCPLPPQGFWNLLSIRATRRIFDELAHDSGLPFTMKWRSRTLWGGRLATDVTMAQLEGILEVTMFPAMCPAEPRMIHSGKRATGPMKVGEMQPAAHTDSIMVYIGHSLKGGGKEQSRTQVKNALASTLLENGFELTWVSTTVEDVMTKAGTTQAMYVAQMPGGTSRLDKLMTLIRDCQIEVPAVKTKQAAKQVSHNMTTKQRKMAPLTPDPAQYRMELGYLCNTDGTEAQQIAQIATSACGVQLTTHQEATPWIREGKILSKDELALFVLGHPVESHHLHVTEVHLPCRDSQDRQVILAGSLVQLGAKHVTPKADHNKKINLQECNVISLTLWKGDFREDEWKQILSHTFATIRTMLGEYGTHDHITAMWGRSLRGSHGPANDATAISVQIHATANKTSLIPMLSKSGFNKIFINPKSEKGRPAEQFRVLWLPGDLARVTATAANTEECCGLIRGKKSYGLRYTLDGFNKAWASLHPGEPAPDQRGGEHTFRLEPLPFGVTQQSIHEWAALYSWKIRAVKAVGPKAWLISSASHPPDQLLQFNCHPVIARFIAPKMQTPSQPVVAGPRPRKGAGKGKPSFPSPDNNNPDPWASYTAQKAQGPNGAQSAVPPPRTTEGPIEAKFKQQESRIQELEATIKSVSEAQKKGQKQTDIQFEHMNQQITDTKHLVAKTLEQTKLEIRQSVDQAMQAQSHQLNQNLAEIKALLIKQPKRGREADAEEMEDD
jgi:site-specific DNA-cytosine methylase